MSEAAVHTREFLPRTVARQKLKIELEKCWRAHMRVDLQKQEKADSGERGRVPHAPSTAFEITVGTGKTHGAAELAAEYTSVPVLYLVGTHKLGEEFIEKFVALGGNPGDIIAYHGRADKKEMPWHCFRTKDGEALSEMRRIQQPTLCRECEHGLKTQYNIQCEFDTNEAHEKKIAIIEKAAARGFNLDKTKECSWIRHQQQAQRTRIVVAHYASFSSALSVHNFGMRSIARLVVVDETAPLAESITLDATHINDWLRQLPQTLEMAERKLNEAQESFNSKVGTDLEKSARTALNEAKRLHRNCVDASNFLPLMIDWIAESAKQADVAIYPPEGITKYMNTPIETVQDSAAPWEWAKIDSRNTHESWDIPLRATSAILWSMRADSAYAENGRIHCVAPTVLGDAVVQDRQQFVFLDATAPLFIRQIVEVNKGTVVEVNAEQSLRLNVYADTGRARKKIATCPAALEKMYHDVAALRQLCANEICVGPQDIGVLTFKLVADKIGGEKAAAGWWGAHERGTEMFAGLDLLIFGDHRTGRGERDLYECERALALTAGASRAAWPRGKWGGKQVCETRVDGTGGKCASPLPAQPELRVWLIDRFRQMYVQAIGRVRAVGSNRPKTVWICAATAGLIDWKREVGVEPDWRASPLDLKHGRGRGEGSQAANTMSAMSAMHRLADAALRVLRAGELPTRSRCAPAGMSNSTFRKQWPEALGLAMRHVEPPLLEDLAGRDDARYAILRQSAADELDRRLGERMFSEERMLADASEATRTVETYK